MINIDNIIRGICKIDHSKELYDDQIDQFCQLMCKPSFAHKVSKRFEVIYNDNYVFNEFTEDDQIVKPNPDSTSVYLVRLIDDDTYVVIQDYIHTISNPIDGDAARIIVEEGIDKLLPYEYV